MQQQEFQKIYNQSIQDPEKFWADVASEEIEWGKKWDKVFEWNFPNYQWFVGGKLNITHNCLDRHIKNGLGDKIAFIYTNENYGRIAITYAELLLQVNKFANGLKSLGVKKGDRVVLYMPLVIEQIVAMLGCTRIGAVHSVVFAGFSDKALRERIEDLQAKVVVTATWTLRRGAKKELLPTVEDAVKKLECMEKVIVLDRDAVAARHGAPSKGGMPRHATTRRIDYNRLLENQSDTCNPEVMDSEDPLFVLYTSGSTGKPKGIVHTVGGYSVYTHYTTKKVFNLHQDSIFWCTADPGWITGHSYIVYGPLSNGITSVIVEGVPDYPAPDHWYKIIEEEKVNVFYTSPTAIRMLRKHGEEYCQKHNLSSLKVLGTVGEPINPEVWQWYNKYIGNGQCAIVDTWWQTETGGHMIVTLPGLPQKPGIAGLPFFGIEADVVNQEGQNVPAGEKGFLVIKKPWPSALRTCLNNQGRFNQYWNEIKGVYFTGDFAIKDADGYIQILGRSDDVINISGHRIGTAEVENALVAHPAVSEAAVIPKPDEIKGERMKAFLVLKDTALASEDLIKKIKFHMRHEIAAIAVPDEIEFVPSLPKTRSGKIMRRVLKAQELGQPVGDLTVLDK
ncbi:MAG: acetate--CoA ligase [Patescibacteria group bacterium]|nr:acetate--CoA ligase [Patescibacteria group bacterium]